MELVKFHRDGFGVDNEGWVNDIFVNDLVSTSDSITQVISHFSKCLHRQSTSQSNFFGDENYLKNKWLYQSSILVELVSLLTKGDSTI